MPTRTATLGALIIASAFVLAASLIPYDLTAQESDPITASCVRLTRNLYFGLNDAQTSGQVSALQRFLTQTGDFTYGHTTGYFGPLTEAAVQQWQCRNMQLCSGGPEENGWGVVGPLTRRAMQAGCDAPPTYPPPETGGGGGTGGWPPSDFPTSSNKPPTIHGLSGPTTLKVNETGTWTINASDPENDPLSYRIIWGDEFFAGASVANSLLDFTTSNTFTHTYTRVGFHGLTAIVRDSKGKAAHFFTLVRVTADTADIPHACTQEAKQCPDGSYVGRTGPNCEFAACPASSGASCLTPWGMTIAHGQSITAYQSYELQTSPPQQRCTSETRTCANGVLSGSYQSASCPATNTTSANSCIYDGRTYAHNELNTSTPGGAWLPTRCCYGEWWGPLGNILGAPECTSPYYPQNQVPAGSTNTSCTLDGVTVAHGQSRTFYSTNSVPAGQSCSSVAQTRTCTNGTLSGSNTYNKASCSVSSGDGGTAGASCTYNGQTYANGQIRSEATQCPTPLVVSPALTTYSCLNLNQCINGQWAPGYKESWNEEMGSVARSVGHFSILPTAGVAPLTVSFEQQSSYNSPYTLAGAYRMRITFGDNSAPAEYPCTIKNVTSEYTTSVLTCAFNTSHTYTTPGTYAAKIESVTYINGQQFSASTVWSGMITVTSGTQGNSGAALQLANALTALEEALKGLLNFLTR